jgi:hypothetical protein
VRGAGGWLGVVVGSLGAAVAAMRRGARSATIRCVVEVVLVTSGCPLTLPPSGSNVRTARNRPKNICRSTESA